MPILNYSFHVFDNTRLGENRTFTDSLNFNVAQLDSFPENFEAFYEDNFPLRTAYFKAYHKMKFFFQVSPHPETAVLGKDEWVFLTTKYMNVYQGREYFNHQQVDSICNMWQNRVAYFADQEIKTYWVVGPLKHGIYEEFLPFNYAHKLKENYLTKLNKKFNRDYPDFLIDPSSDFKAQNEKVYYKMDHHWNQKGASITMNRLLDKVRRDFPDQSFDLGEMAWKDSVTAEGYLRNVIGQPDLTDENPLVTFENNEVEECEKYGFEVPNWFAYPWNYEWSYHNPNAANDLTVLVIRDSFGDACIPFIQRAFKNSVFIFDGWQYGLNQEIVDVVKPDVIVYITYEAFLDNLLKHEK